MTEQPEPCTCKVTKTSTRFDSKCPYHGDNGTMVAEVRLGR